MFGRMKKDTEAIIAKVVQLVYFMRGAIQYQDMMFMSAGERDIIDQFVKDRLEAESQKPSSQQY